MYLSQLRLKPMDRKVHRILSDPYKLHAAVMRGFPPEGGARPLFRLEPRTGRDGKPVEVLVQSDVEPDWTPLVTDLADAVEIRTRSFEPEFRAGQTLRFRARVNPAVKRNGRRLGLAGDEGQLAWLRRKGEAGGFRIGEGQVLVIDEGTLGGHKFVEGQSHTIQFRTVLVEGILEVIAPDLLAEAIRKGIGPAKGLGCGLLSVVPSLMKPRE